METTTTTTKKRSRRTKLQVLSDRLDALRQEYRHRQANRNLMKYSGNNNAASLESTMHELQDEIDAILAKKFK